MIIRFKIVCMVLGIAFIVLPLSPSLSAGHWDKTTADAAYALQNKCKTELSARERFYGEMKGFRSHFARKYSEKKDGTTYNALDGSIKIMEITDGLIEKINAMCDDFRGAAEKQDKPKFEQTRQRWEQFQNRKIKADIQISRLVKSVKGYYQQKAETME